MELPFTLKEAQKYRTQLVHNSYKRFEEKKGNPSGYFLHFSPRKRFGDHHLLEYGFTGAQTLLAYDMLVAACRDEFDVPLTGAREMQFMHWIILWTTALKTLVCLMVFIM